MHESAVKNHYRNLVVFANEGDFQDQLLGMKRRAALTEAYTTGGANAYWTELYRGDKEGY